MIAIAVPATALILRDEPAPPPPLPPPAVRPTESVTFDFDSGIHTDSQGRYVVDTTGHQRGYEIPNGGGAGTLVDRGQGKALKFPPSCAGRTTPECPGAIVEVADAGFLNPGTRPFSYGADVLVSPEDPAPGANIVQKGIGISPTNPSPNQWKFELNSEGKIRCVLVTKGTGAITATSSVVVTDGTWHKVACEKTANALSVKVDASDPVSVPLPPDLELTSPGQPLRLGGNNRMGSGRFTGAVDNVYYRLETSGAS